MAQVYVSIGSNQDRTRYIRASLDAMTERFDSLQLSSVYESEAVGFDGDNFYNLVAGFSTDLPVGELSRVLKGIEDDNGRCRKGPKFSGRTLDIDILTYDTLIGDHDGVQLPRDEILKNAFVLRPLAEIAPEASHPQVGDTYQVLWQSYTGNQVLWTVDFDWQGQTISSAE